MPVRIAREPARARRRGQEEALSRGAARPTSTTARQSRELARIRTDVPVEFDAEALRYRGGSRERCFADLQRARLPRARQGIRADRRHDREDLPDRQHRRGRRARWPSGCAPRADSRCGSCPTGRRRCARRSSASRSRPRRATPTTCRSATGRSATPRACRSTIALDALRPVLEDEAIGKDGHDLKFDAIVLARHGVTLRGLDIDTMLASYLLDATRSEHLLEDLALEHTSYKALTEEDVCGRGAKAVSLADVPVEAALDLRRRARRSRRAARAAAARAAREGTADRGLRDARAAAHAGADRRRARRRPHRPAGAGGAVAEGRAGAGAADRRRSSRWPAASSTSTRRSSSPRSCSTSCSCRC